MLTELTGPGLRARLAKTTGLQLLRFATSSTVLETLPHLLRIGLWKFLPETFFAVSVISRLCFCCAKLVLAYACCLRFTFRYRLRSFRRQAAKTDRKKQKPAHSQTKNFRKRSYGLVWRYSKARVARMATIHKGLSPNSCNRLAMQNVVKNIIISLESESFLIRWSCRLTNAFRVHF